MFIIFLIFSTISFAQNPELSEVVKAVKKFTAAYESKPLQISWNQKNTPKGFQIACPIGELCPDKSNRLVYLASTRQHPEDVKESWLRLFFKINELEEVNLVQLTKKFSFASFSLDLSHHFKFPGYMIVFSESGDKGIIDSDDKKDWKFTSLSKGILKGELKKKYTSVSISRVDDWAAKNCNILSEKRPVGCWEEIKIHIPIELNFALPLEMTELDCQDATNEHPRCGH